MKNFYVKFKKNIHIEEGIKFDALYDLNSNEIYHISKDVTKICNLLAQNLTISEIEYILNESFDHILEYLFMNGLVEYVKKKNENDLINFKKNKLYLKYLTKNIYDHIIIELTDKCNLNCIHCYVDANSNKNNFLDKDVVKKIIIEASKIGFPSIRFTGGEPFLYDKLLDILEFCAKYFNHIELSTNATLLNEKIISYLKDLGIILQFSIYSLKNKIHDKITGIPGSCERLKENIKLLNKYGINFEANYIITKFNENDFDEVKKFIKENNGIIDSPDLIRPCDKNTKRVTSKKFFNKIRKTKRYFVEFNKEQFYRNITGNSCWRGLLVITAGGDVIPCVMARNLILGSIKKESLEKIINKEKVKFLWRLNREMYDECMFCEFKFACFDCRASNLNSKSGLLAKSYNCNYNPIKGKWKR